MHDKSKLKLPNFFELPPATAIYLAEQKHIQYISLANFAIVIYHFGSFISVNFFYIPSSNHYIFIKVRARTNRTGRNVAIVELVRNQLNQFNN